MSEHSELQAKAQLDSIVKMMAALERAREDGKVEYDGDTYDENAMQEYIEGDPLEIAVRSDWHSPSDNGEAGEYKILLCTGGPAVQVIGGLNEYCQPTSSTLQHQDWFEGWQDYHTSGEEDSILLDYAQLFWYGE